jgi:3-oxocholest-4-en-26-oyl-CoA dehydrogenase alpha subunit
MDFKPIAKIDEIKGEFDSFFKEIMKKAPSWWTNSPDDLETEEGQKLARLISKELGKRSWICMGWLKKYGGLEKDFFTTLAFQESMAYWRAPGWDFFGAALLGPTLLIFGNDEQKDRFLPPIARGEEWWAQLWSEPDAGSDLANVSTFAKKQGDEYIVNGQKIWTSNAHKADWGFALVRTAREMNRSRGLSLLLLDLKSPGVTIRPLPTMSSYGKKIAHFNEIFLDDVHVPLKNIVGQENEGWRYIRETMNFERGTVTMGHFLEMKRTLGELVKFCQEKNWQGEPLSKNLLFRNRLAQIATDIEVGLSSNRHILWGQHKLLSGQGKPADLTARSSSIKYFGSELDERIGLIGLQIMNLYGQLKRESRWAPMEGKFESKVQYDPNGNIAAGSTEIQKNIIAWETLGLPRT